MKSRITIAACLALAITVPRVSVAAAKNKVVAEKSSPSEEHIQKGIELRRSGDDIGALSEYEAAYRIDPSPRAAAQLGICNHALGRWVMAEKYTVEALRSKNDPWVIKNRSILLESVNTVKRHLGFLSFRGEPDGSVVRMNGVIAGTLPTTAPVRVAVGTVEVSAKAPGYKEWRKSLTVLADETSEVYISLEKEKGIPDSLPMPLAKSEQEDMTTMPSLQSANAAGADEPFLKRPWVWVAAGALLATVVVTAVVLSRTETTETFACADCVDTTGVRVK